jgi:uncharacterized protein GlcG (DUF336 family)
MGITYDQARLAIDAALQKADELGLAMSVAVLDGGRNLVVFARQDAAILGTIEVAVAKANTAVSFHMATCDVQGLTEPGQPLYGFGAISGGMYISWGGGRPISAAGGVIGAIGASGGTAEQDDEVALAGIAALGLE